MTPDQLHDALYTIGWSQRDLGDRLRVDREMLRGWNQGTTEIPSRVGDWLEYLSDVHEQALLPSGWEFPVKQERADVDGEVQMSMRVVSTELGVVARETFPSGEQAYRRNHDDGSWNHSPDHKGPWIVVPPKDVPERFKSAIAERAPDQQPESLQELPEGFVVIEHDPGSGIWVVATPDRDELPPAFTSREEALAWTKTKAFEQAAAQHRKEAGDDLDADLDRLDRLEHEQGTTAELWSGDRGAELERLELDPETHSERGRSEPPERGIEDDEELER